MHRIDTYLFSNYKVQNVEIKQHVKLNQGFQEWFQPKCVWSEHKIVDENWSNPLALLMKSYKWAFFSAVANSFGHFTNGTPYKTNSCLPLSWLQESSICMNDSNENYLRVLSRD